MCTENVKHPFVHWCNVTVLHMFSQQIGVQSTIRLNTLHSLTRLFISYIQLKVYVLAGML